MKKILLACLAFALLGFTSKKDSPITIFMIGDSTMANKNLDKGALERGWGMMLPNFFTDDVVVDNYARNGRSSKSFMNEGLWDKVCEKMRPGDYVFIQFGHNDSKSDSGRFTDPETTFKENLLKYISETRKRKAIPVLFTSIVRRSFDDDGKLIDTHGRYVEAVREVADAHGVMLIDLNNATHNLVQEMGVNKSKDIYMWVKANTNFAMPEGKEDNTHLNIKGGRIVAKIAADSIRMKMPNLARFIRYYDFVVAKDGSGDFFTVQEAINAVPDFRKESRTTILIREGIYKEKLVLAESKINVSFIGKGADKTILTYDDYAQKKNIFGENKSTSGSASFYVYGHDFHAEDITFENTAGRVGQAVAIFVNGDKAVFKRCKFLGNQDTLYTYGKQSRQYYEDCYIEGTVDFIFGSSTAYFEHCTIHSKGNGYITAASTPQTSEHGYVFNDCVLTADDNVTNVFLGRPWRPYAKVVFMSSKFEAPINPEGWHNWGKAENEKTAFFAEYNNTGKSANLSKRVPWCIKLNSSKAQNFTIEKVLAGSDSWNPTSENS